MSFYLFDFAVLIEETSNLIIHYKNPVLMNDEY